MHNQSNFKLKYHTPYLVHMHRKRRYNRNTLGDIATKPYRCFPWSKRGKAISSATRCSTSDQIRSTWASFKCFSNGRRCVTRVVLVVIVVIATAEETILSYRCSFCFHVFHISFVFVLLHLFSLSHVGLGWWTVLGRSVENGGVLRRPFRVLQGGDIIFGVWG